MKKKEYEIMLDLDLVKKAGYYDASLVSYTPPNESNNYIGTVGIDLVKRYGIHFKDIKEANRNIDKLLKQLMKQNRG